ncbi:hypothetical protein ASE01_21995 [Nocardioides sp. Root190]|uniref:type IV pilus modification PilV family protein n=1 Tax=Nocardioides sp. Root190 TaxID=1736488 RepID=UPI0006F94421|nr:type II secretion system protein [Nocardioides sp. Root190]KRB72724.1 hypothetical protein ASE01_21995 [Nocardioides sp. Root190]
MLRPRDLRSDGGATLVEMLVAIVILSTAGLAVMAGLQLSIKTADIHRKQSTGGAYVRSYAEAIEKYVSTSDANYKPCAGANAYNPATIGFTAPSGYTAGQAQAVPLNGLGVTGSCPGGDVGTQRLTLSMRSNDGRATERLTIVLRKTCGPGSSCP